VQRRKRWAGSRIRSRASWPADYDTDAERGVVVVASLPKGDYEVYGLSVFFNVGMTTSALTLRQPFRFRSR
jgi:hypothetical protein